MTVKELREQLQDIDEDKHIAVWFNGSIVLSGMVEILEVNNRFSDVTLIDTRPLREGEK